MLKVFIEQFALIGALSTVVLAALWPHARVLVLPMLSKLFKHPNSNHLDNNQNNHDSTGQFADKRPIEDHPRLGGRTLRRMVSEKETIMRTAYNSFSGYGQSQFANEPRLASLHQNGHHHHHHHRASAFGDARPGPFHTFAQNTQSQSGGIQSMSFALVMACVMGLIMFVIMKLLTSRFGKSHEPSGKTNARPNKSSRLHGQARFTTTDLRQDKRKFARLSREERARQLILHHGSKNVSKAMRFLIGELEKQKQQLLAEGHSNTASMNQFGETTRTISQSCSCSCHPKG